MPKSPHKKSQSLTALATSLDTRKKPAPVVDSKAQRAVIENALRSRAASVPVVPPRSEVSLPPVKVPPPPAPSTMNRASALSSMHRSPSPVPAKMPVKATAPVSKADARRAYPRADLAVRARLSLADDPSRSFEATLPTVNLSVGGMFLESSFFLKLGTKLLISLDLPQRGREVKVKGEVVRVETNISGQSGFAVRFSEYLDGSQVILATHFLSPVLREFLAAYAKEHRFEASAEYLAHTSDVLAAWELKKAELGGDVWDLFAT